MDALRTSLEQGAFMHTIPTIYGELAVPSLPVAGQDQRYAVRRIYCTGKNYLAHVREMNGDVNEPPFFFQKPADAIVQSGATVPYPPATRDFHYEAELVIAIGRRGADIPRESALDHVYGYALGLDLTRRDLQNLCAAKQLPWEAGKAFDHSAPVGAIRPVDNGGHPLDRRISLTQNGVVRQDAALADMIWDVPAIIARLSQSCELYPGDLIFTGTPEGVGPAQRGDELAASVEGLPELTVRIA